MVDWPATKEWEQPWLQQMTPRACCFLQTRSRAPSITCPLGLLIACQKLGEMLASATTAPVLVKIHQLSACSDQLSVLRTLKVEGVLLPSKQHASALVRLCAPTRPSANTPHAFSRKDEPAYGTYLEEAKRAAPRGFAHALLVASFPGFDNSTQPVQARGR